MRTRRTYYVNAEHTGRAPVCYTGDFLRKYDRLDSGDYVRVPLPTALLWGKLPHTAQNAWFIAAAKAVLEASK